jgi:hypothetical protein
LNIEVHFKALERHDIVGGHHEMVFELKHYDLGETHSSQIMVFASHFYSHLHALTPNPEYLLIAKSFKHELKT